LVRQYLADGYYPKGSKNESNARFDNPSAALVKAMLVSSAKPVRTPMDRQPTGPNPLYHRDD